MELLDKLREYFEDGGFLMYPLAACSLIALAVILERLVRLRRSKLIDTRVVEDIQTLVEQGNIELAINRNRSNRSLTGRVLCKALNEYIDQARAYGERYVPLKSNTVVSSLGTKLLKD